jgi:hypothetical protein
VKSTDSRRNFPANADAGGRRTPASARQRRPFEALDPKILGDNACVRGLKGRLRIVVPAPPFLARVARLGATAAGTNDQDAYCLLPWDDYVRKTSRANAATPRPGLSPFRRHHASDIVCSRDLSAR